MKRKIILTACLLLVAGMGVPHLYQQWTEHKRVQAELDYAAQLQQRARQEPDKLVDESKVMLDNWGGGSDDLRTAGLYLQQVLIAHPNHVRARIEMARFILNRGYISYRQFKPGTLDQAEAQLLEALRIDPNAADVYVLAAHIQTLKGFTQSAVQLLEKAEQLGTRNPWLYLNWVNALLDLNRAADAEHRLAQAQDLLSAINPPPKRLWSRFHEETASVMFALRRLDEVDKAYQALLAVEPDYAWGRGNYAVFLLYTRGMPDDAIAMAESALKIMDYGIGRSTLSAALYAKWAEVKQQSPEQAEQYLARGKSLGPNFQWMMTQASMSVGNSPVLLTMVKELMALGVPLNIKDNNEDTGLTLAAFTGDTKSVDLLIQLGADLESRDNYGRTALAGAALRGHADTVRLLAANQAEVNTQDNAKLTPLHLAVSKNNAEMVRTMLELKADINNAASGLTPLMRAAVQGHEDMVRLLLESGADPTIKTSEKQQTAADLATEGGFAAVAEVIQAAERQRTRRKR